MLRWIVRPVARGLFRRFGQKAAGRAAERYARRGGVLDVGFGLALFRDRRVPVRTKLTAVALGGLVTILLQPLEIPLEMLWALLAPPLGLVSLVIFNGLEAVLLPLLVGALLVRRLTPPHLVERIRGERFGLEP